MTYLLIATGTISLSVRLLTTLGTGDVQCILLLVNSTVETDEDKDLGPYPSGGTIGLVNYAQTSAACSHAVFNWFWLYLPYVMLIQTIFLVIVEKFTFKIPRIAQKVERFYRYRTSFLFELQVINALQKAKNLHLHSEISWTRPYSGKILTWPKMCLIQKLPSKLFPDKGSVMKYASRWRGAALSTGDSLTRHK